MWSSLFSAVCVVLLFFFSPASMAAPELSLRFTDSPLCREITMVIYTRSTHPGGNPRGKLNENNGGYGGRCYTEKENNWYVLTGGLMNSQWGSTFVFGPGLKFRPIEIWRLSLDAGIELPFVNYERPFRQTKRGILPVWYVGGNINLPMNLGEIGIVRSDLANAAILYSIVWTRRW